jgi:hypothetical protein
MGVTIGLIHYSTNLSDKKYLDFHKTPGQRPFLDFLCQEVVVIPNKPHTFPMSILTTPEIHTEVTLSATVHCAYCWAEQTISVHSYMSEDEWFTFAHDVFVDDGWDVENAHCIRCREDR